jgi:hypothetical protein
MPAVDAPLEKGRMWARRERSRAMMPPKARQTTRLTISRRSPRKVLKPNSRLAGKREARSKPGGRPPPAAWDSRMRGRKRIISGSIRAKKRKAAPRARKR